MGYCQGMVRQEESFSNYIFFSFCLNSIQVQIFNCRNCCYFRSGGRECAEITDADISSAVHLSKKTSCVRVFYECVLRTCSDKKAPLYSSVAEVTRLHMTGPRFTSLDKTSVFVKSRKHISTSAFGNCHYAPQNILPVFHRRLVAKLPHFKYSL